VRRSRKCPVCGETGIPIVYGYPNHVDLVAAEQGVLVLGGCVIYGDDPTWYCKLDKIAWDGPNPTKAIEQAVLNAQFHVNPSRF
jgi:hypothetical protein